MVQSTKILIATMLFGVALATAGCTGQNADSETASGPFSIPDGTTSITGSGSSFVKPLMEQWSITYQQLHSNVQVSYAGGGSGKGQSDILARNVLFAASDAPLSKADYDANPGIMHIPVTLGAVGVVYNVKGVPDGLKLDGDTLGNIYTGKISKWNDPAITALNPGVNLPDHDIVIVYRSDSSGTTYTFTDYLRKVSDDWATKMGNAPTKKPDWTKSSATQLSGNGNDGVGDLVKKTPYSIGYVELAYVNSLKLPTVALENQEGEFIQPTTEAALKAAAGVADDLPDPEADWSQVSITDAAGTGAYPISTLSYVLVFKDLADYNGKYSASAMEAFQGWLWWCLHTGQSYGPELGYASLPDEVVQLGEDAVQRITV